MSKIFFTRHGQSKANVDKVLASPNTPLARIGRSEAKRLGQELKIKKITKIVSSPYIRALDTACIIAGQLGIEEDEIIQINDLKERGVGPLEGQNIKDREYYYTDRIDNELNVEKSEELLSRMVRCWQNLQLIQTETLLVVGHGVSGHYLQQSALGSGSVSEFKDLQFLDNTSLIMLKE